MRGTIKVELSVDDLNLILEALGALSFVRVYQLISRLQAATRDQLGAAE